MSLNDTPSADRLHIGFFGVRNAGKSSVVNAVTGQDLSVVSDTLGTTTDPVKKAMELLPLGPVVIIDTPGFDDEGALGDLRVKKTKQILNRTDIAVLCVDAVKGLTFADSELIEIFRQKEIPYVIVYNKSDLLEGVPEPKENEIYVSALNKTNINELKELIGKTAVLTEDRPLVSDLLNSGDTVILVTPIDSAAPKGRMILPQQQMLRDILDGGSMACVVKEDAVGEMLVSLKEKPKMVITDSQAFGVVSKAVPDDIPLTSFSILMARRKGYLESSVKAVSALRTLGDGDTVLISEGCTHHRQCGDIGTVKIPAWIKAYTGKDIKFEVTSGADFPDDLSKYKLIFHCGGCMLNEREMKYRKKHAEDCGVPMTNYGVAIAAFNGILSRSLSLFPDLQKLVD